MDGHREVRNLSRTVYIYFGPKYVKHELQILKFCWYVLHIRFNYTLHHGDDLNQ